MAGVANIQTTEQKKRTRSPAYPDINLETAIARAKEFYDKEQRNAANVNVAVKHWGFVEGSSNGAQTIAAMSSFGLLQDEGTGGKRKVRLTQNALRILLDTRPDSAERAQLIKQAALAPRIHNALWHKWGDRLPSDASLRHTLLLEWPTPFNENAVDGFIREYKDTIAFANLSESDMEGSEVQDKPGEEQAKGVYVPKVGDYVQWESLGVLRFTEPKRVRELSTDGKFAFVEGQYAGLPVGELIRAGTSLSISNPSEPSAGRISPPPKTVMQEFVVPLSDGSRAVFQWPSSLSAEDVTDLKDSLKIVERKIARSVTDSPDGKSDNLKTWEKLGG